VPSQEKRERKTTSTRFPASALSVQVRRVCLTRATRAQDP
jgi:hypothetical protein